VPVNPVVTQGAAPSSTATTTATSCPGVADGTLTVAAVGAGTTYTLNPGTISNTTGLFTGLAAGSYTITFVTAAGCNGTVSINPVVAAGPAISGTALATNTSCPTVNDGTITVSAPSGAGTSYTLNPGAITNTTGIFTGLAPNTYTIGFVTGAGCTGTITTNTTISAGPLLTSTFAQTNPNCANINDGVITITPQAGTTAPYAATLTGPGGPYTYTGPAPIVFTGLAPGTYNYSYSEAGGCTGTGGPITLVTNAPIYVPATLTNLSCNSSANGSVSFNPVGGVAPYQYSINGGVTYQASNTFTGLAAGPHSFRIRDNAGCTKDTTVTLTQPTTLTVGTTGTTPAGCSNNDGSISAAAAGGTGPYTYTIAGPTVNTSGTPSGIFTGLANGYYTVTATDAQGCSATTTGTVGLTDNMFLTLGPDVTICAESSVTFDPQSNPETNIFTWTAINGTATGTIANPSIKNAIATPPDTATYVLHAQWGGCERRDTIVVNVLRKPVANAGLDTAICNLTYAILRGSAGNLSGAVNYTWSPATDVEFPTQAVTRVYPPGNNTVYTYTLTVRDEYGCNFSVTDQVDVTVQPPVPAFAGNDTTAVLGSPHQLSASGGDDYLWSPSAPLNSATVQNPLATLSQDQKFVVRVTDFAGCIGYDTVFVKVYSGPAYYIPNAFTPNGDGLNDVFRPVPAGIARTEYFRIFNRFGETIFETNQYLKGWDGTYKGKKQPIGAYVWIIKGIDRDGKKIELKGTVMLVQ
jgi:gliding motility-associated-like protein